MTHGSLLRNLANSALRRAAAAGDARALAPGDIVDAAQLADDDEGEEQGEVQGGGEVELVRLPPKALQLESAPQLPLRASSQMLHLQVRACVRAGTCMCMRVRAFAGGRVHASTAAAWPAVAASTVARRANGTCAPHPPWSPA